MSKFLIELIKRRPELENISADIKNAYEIIVASLRNNGTLFTCGNGGSAADSEHIVGELLKGFVKKRPLDDLIKNRFSQKYGDEGKSIAEKLQEGLRAVSLTSHPAFNTAFLNDVDGSLIYGQQLYALGRKGDVLLGITCSGNAENIRKAMMTANIKEITTILLTGNKKGICTKYADCAIEVPCSETYMIQEYHLSIYHTLCMMIEDCFYNE